MKLNIDVLDKGFVRIVEHETPINDNGIIKNKTNVAVYGSDNAIVQAARTSYGKGTTTVNDDKNLLRYLLRNKHTSPFEMAEVKFHIKLPIFVMRQLVRHRTASLNEISGRYSVLSSEIYLPDLDNIQPQSQDNKQGRGGMLSNEEKKEALRYITDSSNLSFDYYGALLGEQNTTQIEPISSGVARELSRIVLPLNTYTECYWKMDLHNLMHLLRLRMDKHAQYECREYANAMFELVKQFFPITMKAFEDYILNSISINSIELSLIKQCLDYNTFTSLVEKSLLSKREKNELLTKFEVNNVN